MKKHLYLLAIFSVVMLRAQQGMYRHFPQTAPVSTMPWSGNPQAPQLTADGGYLLKNWYLVMGFESPGGMSGGNTIKTDSAFVPLWKKNYPCALPLPTGGIILFNYNTIEKVTASGAQVWIKHLATPIMLNDAVVYGNKIRFVGNRTTNSYVPSTTLLCYTSDGFTLLADTSGNYISHKLFYSSVVNTITSPSYNYRGSADFSKIKRDSQGNFFVYSNSKTMSGVGSSMSIAKFDTSFSFTWGKTWGNSLHVTQINDIDILPNGRIFASGVTTGNTNVSWGSRAALFKLDAQGNLLAQCFFENRLSASGLVKKANGNYVAGIHTNDSLFMLETDTSMNVSWFKFAGKSPSMGGSVIRNNKLFTPLQYGADLVLISNDLNGNSCASYSMSYTKPTTTITLINFTLSPTTYTTGIFSGTVNSIFSQAYTDSCKCPVFIPLMQNNLCVGNTGTVAVIGTGNVSWYSTATGSSFLQSGSQYTFSSATPTTLTVFAQDSACTANPIRTAVGITVSAVPSLSFSPANPAICYGGQVFVSAMGATNYTWSNNLPNSYVQNLNPLVTTVYTVTGSVAPGCSDTKTVSVTVVQVPTITASSSGSMCLGQTATLSASGGTSYNWSNGQTNATFTVSPNFPGYYSYNVAGSNGVCSGYSSATITVLAFPSLTVVSNPTMVCAGGSATIAATGATTYSWNTGWTGWSMISTLSSNTTYMVTGSNGGCTSTATLNIPVQPLPAVTASSSATLVCAGSPLTFSVSGANTYTWSTGSTASSFTLNAVTGLTTYSVKGAVGTCTNPAYVIIQGAPLPAITASSSPPLLCVGATATLSASGAGTYTWSGGSTNSTFTINPQNPGAVTYSVSGSNGQCSANSQVTFTALPLPVITIAATASSLCAGNAATLTASGASTYTWSNGANGANVISTPSTSTNYTVTGTANTCSSSAGIFIAVQPLPTLAINYSASVVCIGAPVNLTASGANTYTWSNGFNTAALSFTAPSGNTSYSVIGALGNCTASALANIQGVMIPSISVISNPTLLCQGETATITASGANSYTWSNAATGNSILITPLSQINLSVYGANGSCGTTQVFSLNVSPGPTLSVVADRPSMCYGESFTLQVSGANSYTWNTGANSPSLVLAPLATTSYSVTGLNQFGCLNTAYYTQTVDLCLGVKANGQTSGQFIELYPNPNTGSFVIKTLELKENSLAQLVDINGKVLMLIPLKSDDNFVDINHLSKGLYILRITGSGYMTKIIRN